MGCEAAMAIPRAGPDKPETVWCKCALRPQEIECPLTHSASVIFLPRDPLYNVSLV
jgi:hypothetical protein